MSVDPNDPLWAKAQLDPSYITTKGSLAKQLAAIINNYGDSSLLSPDEAALYGVTPDQTAAASGNQYSVLRSLAQQLAGTQTSTGNTAQSHHALNSGAYAAAAAKDVNDAGQRSYNAQQTLQQQLAGLDTQLGNARVGAYQTLQQQALNDPTIPPPSPPPPDAGVAPVAPPPPPGSTNATANWNANPSGYNPTAPQNIGNGLKPPPKPKLPKVPTIGGMGHIT